MRRMVASLLLPFTIDVTYRCASGANQFHLNSLGKPFWTGSVLSLKNLGNEQGRDGSLAARPAISLTRALCAPDVQHFVNGKVAPGPP